MNENEDKIWLASYIAHIAMACGAKQAASFADEAVQVYRERRVQDGDAFDALQSEVDTLRELLNQARPHLRRAADQNCPETQDSVDAEDLLHTVDGVLRASSRASKQEIAS